MLGAWSLSYLYTLFTLLFPCEEATLLFAGDAMMHADQIAVARRADGTYDFSDYFTEIEPWIKSADMAVVNLETPLGGAPYAGYPCFCAPDEYAQALAGAGFDLFLTANNHNLDRRDKGLQRTLDVLDGMGVAHLGTYRSREERDTVLPMVVDVKGFKIAFLNYTYGTNGFTPNGKGVVDYIDNKLIAKDIDASREAGAELVCVAMHWGDEYKLLPNATQKRLAQTLFDTGADMVIGGHPHVIQPMEMRVADDGSNQLLVYSLGNFISAMRTRDTRGGAVVRVRLKRDAEGKAMVDSADYSLVFTVRGVLGKRNYRLVDATTYDGDEWHQECVDFVKAATEIFDAHNVNVPLYEAQASQADFPQLWWR